MSNVFDARVSYPGSRSCGVPPFSSRWSRIEQVAAWVGWILCETVSPPPTISLQAGWMVLSDILCWIHDPLSASLLACFQLAVNNVRYALSNTVAEVQLSRCKA